MERKRYFLRFRGPSREKALAGEITAWPSVVEDPFRFRCLGTGRHWLGTGSGSSQV